MQARAPLALSVIDQVWRNVKQASEPKQRGENFQKTLRWIDDLHCKQHRLQIKKEVDVLSFFYFFLTWKYPLLVNGNKVFAVALWGSEQQRVVNARHSA